MQIEQLNVSFTSVNVNVQLPKIKKLYCNDNKGVNKIGSLGYNLDVLHCFNCPNLKQLPLISPNISDLKFDIETIESIGGFCINEFGTPFDLNKYKTRIREFLKYARKIDDNITEKDIFEYIVFK